jgi:uncharacterized protein (TIGR02099 family)
MIHIVTRATKHFLILSVILGAIGITGLRWFLSQIESYKQLLEEQVSAVLEAQVTIGAIRASLRGFEPELVLQEISISGSNQQQPIIYVRELYFGIDLINAIKNRLITNLQVFLPKTITLVGAKLSVLRNLDGDIVIKGLKAGDEDPLWLLQGKYYQLLDSEISWQDLQSNREALTFKHINLFLENDLEQQSHRVNLHVQLPKSIGNTLTVASQFTGNPFDSEKINARIYVKGQALHLSNLGFDSPITGFQITSGMGDLELWSQWENSALSKVTGNIQIQQGAIKRQDGEILSVDEFSTLFNWQQQKEMWRINVEHLSWQQKGKATKHRKISVQVNKDESRSVQTIAAYTSVMDLTNLSRIAWFFQLPDPQQIQEQKKIQATGKIKNLTLFADFRESSFAVNGMAERVSLSAAANMPSIENFSGFISGTEQTGSLLLSTDNAAINFPEIFREPLRIKQLQGRVDWQRMPDKLQVSSPKLILDTPDIKTLNAFQLDIPENFQDIFLDLQSEFFDGRDMTQVKHYLPAKIMDQEMVRWLENFFVAGDVEQGKALFYGRLEDFPFVPGNGVFEVLFAARAAELAFDPAWPNLTQVDAEVLFFGESLSVRGHYGQVQGMEIQWADVSIPKLGESEHLVVKGETLGSIEQGLDFILLSPLAEWVKPVLETIAPKGKASVKVDLAVPLIDAVELIADITVHIDHAQLTVLPLDLPVTNITGDLHISESEIGSDNLTATALGHPISLNVNHQNEQTQLKITGQSDIEHLQQQFASPWWKLGKGKLTYNIDFSIPDNEQQAAKLIFHSNLEGLTLALPGELAKNRQQQRHLAMQFDFSAANLLPVKLNYMDKFKVALNFNCENQELYSADILYGEGNVSMISKPEVNIKIKDHALNVDSWQQLAETFDNNLKSSTFWKFNHVDVQLEQLVWQEHQLGKFDLQLQRKENQFLGETSNQFFQGTLSIPVRSSRDGHIKLKLDYLDIFAVSQLNLQPFQDSSFSPMEFPEIELSSRQVIWQSANLGELNLHLQKLNNGLAIKQLDLIAADKKLSAKGSWTVENGKQQTHVNGFLDIDDLGVLLSEMDVTQALQDSEAFFDYVLFWPGAPQQVSLQNITGEIRADLEQGRLLGVEPGLGRALGLLDFWQLDRRLRLDFSDLYSEGFAYNRIYGSFILADGNALTNDLIVDGLPAKIEVEGRTGLVAKDFDQIITVLPKSSVVVPIAGTIVGRVMDYFKQSWTGEKHVGGFFNSSQYALQGKWDNVAVTPLYENDGLLQKAWKGITSIADEEEIK